VNPSVLHKNEMNLSKIFFISTRQYSYYFSTCACKWYLWRTI